MSGIVWLIAVVVVIVVVTLLLPLSLYSRVKMSIDDKVTTLYIYSLVLIMYR